MTSFSNSRLLSLPLLAALLIMALTGCAGPKVVAGSTGTKDQVKFLYVQDNHQGIIKCKVEEDGKPSGCREITLNLKD
jgi:hypothetical protein